MPGEVGRAFGEIVQFVDEDLDMVVIAQNKMEVAVRPFVRGPFQPGDGFARGFAGGAESAPAKIEGVSVEDEDVGIGHRRFDAGHVVFGQRTPAKQVQVGNAINSFFH